MTHFAATVTFAGQDRIILCNATDVNEVFAEVRTTLIANKWHSASIRSVREATSDDVVNAELST